MQTQKGLSFPALVGFGCLITGFWAGYKVSAWLAIYMAPYFYFGWTRTLNENLSAIRKGALFTFSNGEKIYIMDIPYLGVTLFGIKLFVSLLVIAFLLSIAERVCKKLFGISIVKGWLQNREK